MMWQSFDIIQLGMFVPVSKAFSSLKFTLLSCSSCKLYHHNNHFKFYWNNKTMFAIHLSESYFRGLYFAEVDIYIFQVWAAFNLRSRSRWHPQFPKGHEGIPKHHLQPFNWLIKISSRTVSHTNSHFFTKSWYFLQLHFSTRLLDVPFEIIW